MEDLRLYAEPDPVRPVICFDESPKQLIGECVSHTATTQRPRSSGY